MKKTEPTAVTVLRQLLIGYSSSDNGTRHVINYARTNGIPVSKVLMVIEAEIIRRDALIAAAQLANRQSGMTIVLYEDKYSESDEQRFNYAPQTGYLILCPHAELIGSVIDGQFIPRMKTIWESDGTDGPVAITAPPQGWESVDA